MEERKLVNDEIVLQGKPGIPMLLLGIFLPSCGIIHFLLRTVID